MTPKMTNTLLATAAVTAAALVAEQISYTRKLRSIRPPRDLFDKISIRSTPTWQKQSTSTTCPSSQTTNSTCRKAQSPPCGQPAGPPMPVGRGGHRPAETTKVIHHRWHRPCNPAGHPVRRHRPSGPLRVACVRSKQVTPAHSLSKRRTWRPTSTDSWKPTCHSPPPTTWSLSPDVPSINRPPPYPCPIV